MANEIAAAAMTARMTLPDIEEKDKPKHRPIQNHVPRMEVELSPWRRNFMLIRQLIPRSTISATGGPSGKTPFRTPAFHRASCGCCLAMPDVIRARIQSDLTVQ